MSDSIMPRGQVPSDHGPQPVDEGGLRAPPGLSFWRKVWWWFDFLILVKLARLRFIGILVVIGLVIVKWDTLNAYYERWTRSAGHEHAASSDVEYFCPMHPTVIRDNSKEKCPICFMPLSKRKKGEAKEEALPPGIANRVQLSPYRVVLAGIQTWQVSYVQLTKEIVTVGSVEFDERAMKQVTARVKGYIGECFVNETGRMVHVGQELALLYSPDLLSTMQLLLDAKSNGDTAQQANHRKRLKLWGVSDKQIDEIVKSGEASTYVKIVSPIKGHVIKKFIEEGQAVEDGSPLYKIVDLATVWIQAQVYEDDIAFLPKFHQPLTKDEAAKIGLPVTATTLANPGHTFEAKLTFVYPHVDQDTRTVIARFELDNSDHELRPGSSATIKLKIPPTNVAILHKTWQHDLVRDTTIDSAVPMLFAPFSPVPRLSVQPLLKAAGQAAMLQQGLVLAVPDTAVIDTGTLKLVYREVGPGEYEGVKVELGPRMVGPDEASYFPVLRGLKRGDMIATAGSFLLDAETRLNPAIGSIYFGGSGGGSKTGGSTVKPSTPEDMDAKIKVALANLPPEDRRLAEAQKYCPVLKDSLLGSMGTPIKVMLQGQPVFVCCDGCVKGAQVRPQKTLEKVQQLKKANAAAAGK